MQEIQITPAVVGYILDKNKQVLLGLRKKVSNNLGHNLFAGIGGKVGTDPGYENESREEALIREFKEEINVQIEHFKYMGQIKFIFLDKAKWCQDVAIYIIDNWQGIPQETEVIKPTWFALDKIPWSKMWDDNQYWLPKVLAGESINKIIVFDKLDKVQSVVNLGFES